GREILARVVEAYRKIRNTLRYLLMNLYDFDPATDCVPGTELEEIDRYILARYAQVATRMLDGYRAYNWSAVCQALTAFSTVDVSAIYANVTKDRMYTFAARSRERRSAQTVMYHMADGLIRLLAPIRSFTSDEAWRYLPGQRVESVHIAVFPTAAELEPLMDRDLLHRWKRLIDVREQVLAEIEPLRTDKRIGSSLQARVVISAPEADLSFLQRYAPDLPMLFIVSQVDLRAAPSGDDRPLRVTIERAEGVKCARCWRYVASVSTEPAWEGLCERCQEALAETVNG